MDDFGNIALCVVVIIAIPFIAVMTCAIIKSMVANDIPIDNKVNQKKRRKRRISNR